jgi:hypothetical protein
MGLSNQDGHLVLATGNKTELAVGYSTLYGDSVGGFAPIKDVPKTLVWKLARWRNADADKRGETAPIPENTITKPPSAELRPGQLDTDSPPAYAARRESGQTCRPRPGWPTWCGRADPTLVERAIRPVTGRASAGNTRWSEDLAQGVRPRIAGCHAFAWRETAPPETVARTPTELRRAGQTRRIAGRSGRGPLTTQTIRLATKIAGSARLRLSGSARAAWPERRRPGALPPPAGHPRSEFEVHRGQSELRTGPRWSTVTVHPTVASRRSRLILPGPGQEGGQVVEHDGDAVASSSVRRCSRTHRDGRSIHNVTAAGFEASARLREADPEAADATRAPGPRTAARTSPARTARPGCP